jgi:hypothetical protein
LCLAGSGTDWGIKLHITPVFYVFPHAQTIASTLSASKYPGTLLTLMKHADASQKSKLSYVLGQLSADARVRDQLGSAGLESLIGEAVCFRYLALDDLPRYSTLNESSELPVKLPAGTIFEVDRRIFIPVGVSGDGFYKLRLRESNIFTVTTHKSGGRKIMAKLIDTDSKLYKLLGRLANGSDPNSRALSRKGRVPLLMKIANTADDDKSTLTVAESLRRIISKSRVSWRKACALYEIVPVVESVTMVTETTYKVRFSLGHTLEVVEADNIKINFMSVESRDVYPGSVVAPGPKWKGGFDENCKFGQVVEVVDDSVLVKWNPGATPLKYGFRPRKEEVLVLKDSAGNIISYRHDAMVNVIIENAVSLKSHTEFSLRLINQDVEKSMGCGEFARCAGDYVSEDLSAVGLCLQLSYNPSNKDLADALKSIRIYVTAAYDPSNADETSDVSLEEESLLFLIRVVVSETASVESKLAALGALEALCRYDTTTKKEANAATFGNSCTRSAYLDRVILDSSGVFVAILRLLTVSQTSLAAGAWKFMDSLIVDGNHLLDLCGTFPRLLDVPNFMLFASYAMFRLTHRKFNPMSEKYVDGTGEHSRNCRLNSAVVGTINFKDTIDPKSKESRRFPAMFPEGSYLSLSDNMNLSTVRFERCQGLRYIFRRGCALHKKHQLGVYLNTECSVVHNLISTFNSAQGLQSMSTSLYFKIGNVKGAETDTKTETNSSDPGFDCLVYAFYPLFEHVISSSSFAGDGSSHRVSFYCAQLVLVSFVGPCSIPADAVLSFYGDTSMSVIKRRCCGTMGWTDFVVEGCELICTLQTTESEQSCHFQFKLVPVYDFSHSDAVATEHTLQLMGVNSKTVSASMSSKLDGYKLLSRILHSNDARTKQVSKYLYVSSIRLLALRSLRPSL